MVLDELLWATSGSRRGRAQRGIYFLAVAFLGAAFFLGAALAFFAALGFAAAFFLGAAFFLTACCVEGLG